MLLNNALYTCLRYLLSFVRLGTLVDLFAKLEGRRGATGQLAALFLVLGRLGGVGGDGSGRRSGVGWGGGTSKALLSASHACQVLRDATRLGVIRAAAAFRLLQTLRFARWSVWMIIHWVFAGDGINNHVNCGGCFARN